MNEQIPYGSQRKPQVLAANYTRRSQPTIPGPFYKLLWITQTEALGLTYVMQSPPSAPLIFCLGGRTYHTAHVGCQGTNVHLVETGSLVYCCSHQVSWSTSFPGLVAPELAIGTLDYRHELQLLALCGPWDLNSGPQTYTASAFTLKSSPNPVSLHFLHSQLSSKTKPV